VTDAVALEASGFGSSGVHGGPGGIACSAERLGVAAVFRLMDPVTESSPCSSTVTRANKRSRSLFNVSMAEDRRLTSFSLPLAID